MKIELVDEDIFHLKQLLSDKDITKIAFDKQDVWPVKYIIDTAEEIMKSKCSKCKKFDLYWDGDHETKETCDQRIIPDNCSNYLCNDPKSGCPLLNRKRKIV